MGASEFGSPVEFHLFKMMPWMRGRVQSTWVPLAEGSNLTSFQCKLCPDVAMTLDLQHDVRERPSYFQLRVFSTLASLADGMFLSEHHLECNLHKDYNDEW